MGKAKNQGIIGQILVSGEGPGDGFTGELEVLVTDEFIGEVVNEERLLRPGVWLRIVVETIMVFLFSNILSAVCSKILALSILVIRIYLFAAGVNPYSVMS
jgi:hypothetical protein